MQHQATCQTLKHLLGTKVTACDAFAGAAIHSMDDSCNAHQVRPFL